jgi:cell wall-associated NlpC family hydrolase
MSGSELAAAAEELAGAPFRLQGRDPQTGLDCIGVLSAALSAIGRPVAFPIGYRLRASRLDGLETWAAAAGFAPASLPFKAGDVLIVRPGACQFHLLILLPANRFVHAHARLKRVAVAPGPVPWPIAGHWRLARET